MSVKPLLQAICTQGHLIKSWLAAWCMFAHGHLHEIAGSWYRLLSANARSQVQLHVCQAFLHRHMQLQDIAMMHRLAQAWLLTSAHTQCYVGPVSCAAFHRLVDVVTCKCLPVNLAFQLAALIETYTYWLMQHWTLAKACMHWYAGDVLSTPLVDPCVWSFASALVPSKGHSLVIIA